MLRRSWSGLAVVALVALSSQALALESENSYEERASMLSYGIDGLFAGALIGLAAGYLSTGARYQTGEWRKLVIGSGVGAIAGLGVGIGMGVIDDSMTGPGLGSYILQDIGYGTMLGALSGTVVGLLFFVSSNHSKDILVGTSVGGLIGAGVGTLFGIIEGNNARRRYARRHKTANLGLLVATAMSADGAPVLLPTLRATF